MVALQSHNSARANATGGSGVGTVTVDGRVYYPSLPVPSPVISTASVINPTPTMSIAKTDCGGPSDIIKVRDLEATRSTAFGLWAWGFPNGVEQALRAKPGAEGELTYGEWSEVQRDKDGRLVKIRTVKGRMYIIYGYVVGSGAAAGVGYNTTGNATALNGSVGFTTFGKSIDEYSCSFNETVYLIPAKPADPPAPPVTEKSWTLSYEVPRYKVIPVKGRTLPAQPERTIKDSTRRIALPPITVTCDGKGDKPAACPGKPAPGTVIDMTGKE
jgi:hypothetical protein